MSEQNKLIKVGSAYFFKRYDDFTSKDEDYVVIVNENKDFKWSREKHFGNLCIFEVVKHAPEEIIKNIEEEGIPMQIGKFLIPEFNEAIGFTPKQLPLLETLINKIDPKHSYEKIIYRAYKKNNSFKLTDKQRQTAYAEYKRTRQNNG